MSFFPRLTLRCAFEIVEVDGGASAISLADGENDYNGVVELKNDSARFMFKKLQDGITMPELVKACLEEYPDSTVEEVTPIVIDFLDRIGSEGLLAADKEHGIRID